MAVTLNASTSTGLVQSADNSGIIQFQSNGSTKATLSSSGFSYPGAVLQVVTGTTATSASSSTTTYVDSGLTATITPLYSTSKILVLVSQNGITKNPSTTGSGLKLQLVRGSTVLIKIQGYAGYTESNSYNWIGGVSSCYVDSPATTSSTTYKTQFANETNASSVSINSDGSTSVITLLEIAA